MTFLRSSRSRVVSSLPTTELATESGQFSFIDLTAEVNNTNDRGLLGIAIHPDFPNQPYVYLLYTLNQDYNDAGAPIPTWPDTCPSPPGPSDDGCTGSSGPEYADEGRSRVDRRA